MESVLHSFIDIFNSDFNVDSQPIKINKIIIPIIQRDYAQGRQSNDVKRVRKNFLDALYQAVNGAPITLDFVYGDIDKSGTMIPLDGQQRLTTLYLLHWYAVKKQYINEDKFLSNFSYKTRLSATSFCEKLITFNPTFSEKLSEEIINQSWFPLDWKKDPTIASMLVMIDAIDDKFKNVSNLWESLNNGAITFYFLPIKNMGLTDELYIKMNARGKPLTTFEHFKAELKRNLESFNTAICNRIMEEIDVKWTDLLWNYRGNDNIIDDEFLRYFRFICDIICYKNEGTPQGKNLDEFELLDTYFSNKASNFKSNIELLENYFNCWINFNIDEFFEDIFSNEHEVNKIKIDNQYENNIFSDCLATYGEQKNNKRGFPLNRLVLLYAIITYLLHKDSITKEQFIRRLRIVNNLIQNSDFEISDSESRQGGNRLPAILRQVDSIIINEIINSEVKVNFNVNQLKEEIEKQTWLKSNTDKQELLFQLEDNPYLYGQIGIIGIDNIENVEKFNILFNDGDRKLLPLIDSALMAIGNYAQNSKTIYQLGSGGIKSAWETLFHRSTLKEFENTKDVLSKLLDKINLKEDINKQLEDIANAYIIKCEDNNSYDWRYYYIKYDEFRPNRYGKYYWKDFIEKPYELIVIWAPARISGNAYQPFLATIGETSINYFNDNYEGRILFKGESYLTCTNNSYQIKDKEDNLIEEIKIKQDSNGIDIENRIDKIKQYILTKNL